MLYPVKDRLWKTSRFFPSIYYGASFLLLLTLLFTEAAGQSKQASSDLSSFPSSREDSSPMTETDSPLLGREEEQAGGINGAKQSPERTDTIQKKRFQPVGKGSTTAVSGEQYDRGGLHRVIYGGLWRDLWGTEIQVPYLDLEKTAGGLTPTKIGGGRQTTSLKFKGANGREYKFRSVDKEFSTVLPKALQETFVDNILQDMISAQNPVGAVVAAPLLDAAGVLNATPYLFVMPDDPRLGEFREQFAGMLGMIEEDPNEGPGDTPGYMGYTKIVGDDEIYDKLKDHNDNQIDYIDYLKVRLIDILIGDWSRHKDQYRWAKYEVGKENYWRAIPRDRDMAFTRYNGILPWLAATIVPEIEATGEDYPDIENLTWAGRTLDRRFLAPITKREWDSTTAFVVSQLTDNLIREAVHRMPDAMYAEEGEGERLTNVLLSRRDELPEASEEFFEIIHEQSDLWGSDDDEYVEIDRLDDDHVQVAFYRRDKETG